MAANMLRTTKSSTITTARMKDHRTLHLPSAQESAVEPQQSIFGGVQGGYMVGFMWWVLVIGVRKQESGVGSRGEVVGMGLQLCMFFIKDEVLMENILIGCGDWHVIAKPMKVANIIMK